MKSIILFVGITVFASSCASTMAVSSKSNELSPPPPPLQKNFVAAVSNTPNNTNAARQIMKKTINNYLNAKFIIGSGEAARIYSYIDEKREKKINFNFSFNADNFLIDWASATDSGKVNISDTRNYSSDSNGKEQEIEDSFRAISFLQMKAGGEFILAEILYDEAGNLWLNDKIELSLEQNELVNGESNHVLKLSAMSGLQYKIWISEKNLLISKYEIISCTNDGCLTTYETYTYQQFEHQ